MARADAQETKERVTGPQKSERDAKVVPTPPSAMPY